MKNHMSGRRRGVFALALALAGGTAIGLTAVAAPAHAAEKPKYTKDFVNAYKPVEDIFKKATDSASLEAARPLIQPMSVLQRVG